MIRIFLWRHDGCRNGCSVSGHAGYASAGSDIVCAAVSSAVRFLSVMLEETGAGYQSHVGEEHAEISLFSETETAKVLFDGFAVYAKALQHEYPEYIRVTEVQYA